MEMNLSFEVEVGATGRVPYGEWRKVQEVCVAATRL